MKRKFNVGETVRINRTSYNFEKGSYFLSTEFIKVSKFLDAKPLTHLLRDMKDDQTFCGFYDYELKNVKTVGMYNIEKIIKTRTHNGKKTVFVFEDTTLILILNCR